MTKAIITLILAASLCFGQLPIELLMGSKKGLVRAGLVAAYDLRNTGDVQSVANMVAGGPALQRGSSTGSDTNDPTPGTNGWVFDGTDDYGIVSAGGINMTPSDGFSVGLVILTNSSGNKTLISQTTTFYPNPIDLQLGNSPENPIIYLGDGTGGAWNGSTGYESKSITGGITNNGTTWNNFLFTFDALKVGKGYAGKTLATQAQYAANATDSGKAVVVGGRLVPSANNMMAGTIAYVLIYNRPLSAKEVIVNNSWIKAKMAEVSVTLP